MAHAAMTTSARVILLVCGLVSVVWVGVVTWYPFPRDIGIGILIVGASMALAPTLTVMAIVATIKLLLARRKAPTRALAGDTAFLVAGLVLSILGVALCLRITFGLAFE
jgi:hypothetical protein